jgi:RNA polymerase sigma-70 factor, ECF subfamily
MQFYPFNEDYVSRLSAGDPSIGEHFAGYFGELLSMKLRGRVRSPDAAAEIRQETFVRVLQALRREGGLKNPERLGGFVYGVCDNVFLEWIRGNGRFIQMNEGVDDWPDSRIDLNAPLINEERRRLVAAVLAKLRKRDREVLRMVLFEEVDKGEACQRLGVDEDYLRVLLHRATSRFRQALAKRADPAPEAGALKQCGYRIHHKVRYSDGT